MGGQNTGPAGFGQRLGVSGRAVTTENMARDKAGERSRDTRRTVLIAGAANLFVAVIKAAAGLATGSSAMLAESAHSVADTLNQAFLLTSVHRGNRPADTTHPFGYGQERYFWSLLAAFGIFLAGAGFSVAEGVLALRGESHHGVLVAYVVLAISAAAEGTSLGRVLRQLRAEARHRGIGVVAQVRGSPDTTVKTALFEDTTAMTGLLLATVGVTLRQVTGSPVWDGAASIAIGGLLVAVAFKLGADSRELLIGRSAPPATRRAIHDEITQTPGVTALLELLTLQWGPDHLIVAGRVAFSDDISADRAEDLADDIDRRLTRRLDLAVHVFIDPTQHTGGSPGPPAG